MIRQPAWIRPVAVAGVALVGCATLALVDQQRYAGLSPGCPFRLVTGWDCPGCGATRAVAALTQGQVLHAVDHNALLVVLLPLLAWAWVGWLRVSLGQRETGAVLPPSAAFGLAGLLVVFSVVRNIAMFDWLGSSASWSTAVTTTLVGG
ncbi:MAG: DUF2752 domain-containing protein [Nitriliruptoraceae bacterium]